MSGQRSASSLSEGAHGTWGRDPFYLWMWGSLSGPSGQGQQLPGTLLRVTPCAFSSSPPAGIISEQGLREEAPPVLQHHMLRVALELPASKFLWLKAQVGSRGPPVASWPAGCVGFLAWEFRTGSGPSQGWGHEGRC